MSLAGFVKKKKKKKKKHKTLKLTDESVPPVPKPSSVVAETPTDNQDNDSGWIDEEPQQQSRNALATKVGVVSVAEKDKPAHESYAKDLEAEKQKMGFHDVRRAAMAKGEEKAKPVVKQAPISRWGAPKSTRLNITDTTAFPSLGGRAAATIVQPVDGQNMWNKTEEENAELIHMALKAEKKQFISCSQFWGYEYGYFFKNGSEGLGYYKDPHPRDMDAVVEQKANETSGADGETKQPEVKSRFAKKKKKKSKEDGEGGEKKEKKKKKKKKKEKGAAGTEAGAEGAKEKKKKKKKDKAKQSSNDDSTVTEAVTETTE